MIEKHKYIISSTNVDSQGDRMSKSALEGMLPQLNGKRKPRLGLEHVRIFPPLGVIMNGELIQKDNEHFYLTAEMVYFDEQQIISLEDGAQLLKQYFSEGEYPFRECNQKESDKVIIAADPANFDSHLDFNKIGDLISLETDLEFEIKFISRKSELPDPEMIVTVTKTIAVALGLIKSKVLEKVGEAIGDDLAKFYKLITKLTIEMIKRTKPSNRPKNFVIFYPNPNCDIELVINTHKADAVLDSLKKEKTKAIVSKVEQLLNLEPEKIQFIYNENGDWEFNYLLSKSGAAIGTMKSFNRRNDMFNKILEKQNNSQVDTKQ